MAIAYLSAMEKGERNPSLRKSYQTRITAFKEAHRIEVARDKYKAATGKLPASVEMLEHDGYLSPPPVDPYGGKFYLNPEGKVATTSKFAFVTRKKTTVRNKNMGNY